MPRYDFMIQKLIGYKIIIILKLYTTRYTITVLHGVGNFSRQMYIRRETFVD